MGILPVRSWAGGQGEGAGGITYVSQKLRTFNESFGGEGQQHAPPGEAARN